MPSAFQWIVIVGVLATFAWLLVGNVPSTKSMIEHQGNWIDPNDTRQLATLIGMMGGDVKDAAIARHALQRFQEQYGRAATTRDIATVIGIMRTL